VTPSLASGTIADLSVALLLIVGVGIEVLCCVGVLAMRGVYDRLHYTGPAGLGAALIAAAIIVRESFSLIGDKAVLLAVFLVLSSPVLAHVTARAARVREHGTWGRSADERLEVEEP
jgi:multicomponent Na+:H+ antiporter subunit G